MPARFWATRKSLSALRIHAAVSLFIQHGAPADDLTEEPVALLQTPAKIMRSAKDQVQGKGTIGPFQNPHCLDELDVCRHDHEDVHTAVLFGLAFGRRR